MFLEELNINCQFGDKGTKNIAYMQEKTHFQRFFLYFASGWLSTRLAFGYHLDDQDGEKKWYYSKILLSRCKAPLMLLTCCTTA